MAPLKSRNVSFIEDTIDLGSDKGLNGTTQGYNDAENLNGTTKLGWRPPPVEAKVLPPREYQLRYKSIIMFGYLHIAALYGAYLCFSSTSWLTTIFNSVVLILGQLGTTAGAHRLWSHRSYKAKMPLQILLMVMQSMGYQNTIITWAREHRLHHKYSDTDADPHNANRGVFFSHFGWLLVKRHPDLASKAASLDFSDLYNDPLLKFQKRHATLWLGFWCFILPIYLPMWAWGEGFSNSYHITALRCILSVNSIMLINSATHALGLGFRPYDRSIRPNQNIYLSMVLYGEGFHNYHHTFPWDYRSSEYGNISVNLTTAFINAFALIGWAYDLHVVDEEVVRTRMLRTGDGTDLWGYGDKDMTQAIKNTIKTISH